MRILFNRPQLIILYNIFKISYRLKDMSSLKIALKYAQDQQFGPKGVITIIGDGLGQNRARKANTTFIVFPFWIGEYPLGSVRGGQGRGQGKGN